MLPGASPRAGPTRGRPSARSSDVIDGVTHGAMHGITMAPLANENTSSGMRTPVRKRLR